MITLTALLIFFVFLCIPDSPTLCTQVSLRCQWNIMWQALVPLCAQWRVWSKNVPGGVSSTTSNHCRKICWQQAAMAFLRAATNTIEGGQLGASLRDGDQHCVRRVGDWECLWGAANKDCVKGEATHTASGKAGEQLQWDASCRATAVGSRPSTRQFVLVYVCIV